LFHNRTVPGWPYVVTGHVVCLGLVHCLICLHARGRRGRGLDFLRHFYPVVLYTPFYRETGMLNQMFIVDYQDPWFIRLEEHLFGFQPSLRFMESLPCWPVSEVFYASYFSYYIMIAGIGLALFLRNRGQFFHYVAVNSFVFYVCYLTYIALPVMGPRVFFREIDGYSLPADVQTLVGSPSFPPVVQRGVFFHIMAFIYHNFEGPGAAFPSSHVAIALCTLAFSYRYLRRIRFLHTAIVILLCVSTIYCRYHYVVDVLGGALAGALLVPLGDWLYERLAPRARPDLSACLATGG
jgi:membrane-associated phospholipid phosphatase